MIEQVHAKISAQCHAGELNHASFCMQFGGTFNVPLIPDGTSLMIGQYIYSSS